MLLTFSNIMITLVCLYCWILGIVQAHAVVSYEGSTIQKLDSMRGFRRTWPWYSTYLGLAVTLSVYIGVAITYGQYLW